MYVGRFVAVGRTLSGANAALYRVSSRSFPNRMAVDNDGVVAIVPRPGHEGDVHKNPYIAYNALRIAGGWAIATNGAHTDPIAEKVAAGVPVRDAIALVLLTLDYEKDALDTPRIAAAVPAEGDAGVLAIVRRDALVVKEVALAAGRAVYVATYEADDVPRRAGVPVRRGGRRRRRPLRRRRRRLRGARAPRNERGGARHGDGGIRGSGARGGVAGAPPSSPHNARAEQRNWREWPHLASFGSFRSGAPEVLSGAGSLMLYTFILGEGCSCKFLAGERETGAHTGRGGDGRPQGTSLQEGR